MFKTFMGSWAVLFLGFTALASEPDLTELGRRIQSEGLEGRIHGAVADREMWVFTYRSPNDFFSHYEFPLVPNSDAVRSLLATVKRHDKVWIKGEILQNHAPLAHVLVKELEVRGRWEVEQPPYEYEAKIPEDLLSQRSAVFRVHAIVAGGRVLVLEYKDAIVPVFVSIPEQTAGLYRGDKIRLQYIVRQHPGSPTHLAPDPAVSKPFTVVRSILEGHGQIVERVGYLVLFPKSPQIAFDVYALQELDSDGLTLEYTLVNFDDPAVFQAIRTKLATAWNAHSDRAVSGRNKLVNRSLIVKASGILNVQAANQANPQILLGGPDAVTVEFRN